MRHLPDSTAAANWLKATPVTFPILFDVDSSVSKLYEVQGMPNTVILDRKGAIRATFRGAITPDALRPTLEKLLAEPVDAPK